ncbi:hypothetical protein ACX0MV_04525 [Pseudomonas borbori]
MRISIQPVLRANVQCWQVHVDKHSVTFRSESEAQQFISTLETRLKAPHPLPLPAQRIAG